MTRHLRPYQAHDATALWRLFHDTVRHVSSADYSAEQIAAWAPDDLDPAMWQAKMDSIAPLIVEQDGQVLAYADIQPSGYIDHFFVHHQWQRKGVGSLLMREIHRVAEARKLRLLFSNVSITARPFFEAWGFSIKEEQTVAPRGVEMQNYRMEKPLAAYPEA